MNTPSSVNTLNKMMNSIPPLSNLFEGIFENFGSEDGDVRSLGYTVVQPNTYTFTDLAMFKTRKTQRYNHQLEVLLGAEFNDLTLDYCLSKIEESYPDVQNIIAREYKIGQNSQIRDIYARQNITGTIIEHPNTNMLCLKFRGRVTDMYSIMHSDYIYDLAYSLTSYYFENLPPPKPVKVTMTRQEYNRFIDRRIAKRCDENIYCTLSLENIKRGQTIATTCCGHQFKSSELRRWLTKECTEPTCPLCRRNLLTTVNV